jgi:hypothetical protein
MCTCLTRPYVPSTGVDPVKEALLVDAVGLALLVVVEITIADLTNVGALDASEAEMVASTY